MVFTQVKIGLKKNLIWQNKYFAETPPNSQKMGESDIFCLKWSWKWKIPNDTSPLQLPHSALMCILHFISSFYFAAAEGCSRHIIILASPNELSNYYDDTPDEDNAMITMFKPKRKNAIINSKLTKTELLVTCCRKYFFGSPRRWTFWCWWFW